ncbi:TIR domain-containing protein [Providencia rettgeri]
MEKHRVFISYHHKNDQWAKDYLIEMNKTYKIFTDMSVDTGDIDESLPPQDIREIIRDDYLKDTSVLVLLVGEETKKRKHIDWEIYSSMRDGKVNKKSGVLVITLPSSGMTMVTAAHGVDEKNLIHSDISSWRDATNEFDDIYANMPDRILDNLKKSTAYVSVVPWSKINNDPHALSNLIDLTFKDRAKNDYCLSRDMMKYNRP